MFVIKSEMWSLVGSNAIFFVSSSVGIRYSMTSPVFGSRRASRSLVHGLEAQKKGAPKTP